MKKRLLALCLVICMVLGMLPMTAFAADGAYVKATSITVGDTVVIVYEAAKAELSAVSSNKGQYATYSTAPAGVMALTVEAGYSAGTLAFKSGNNYLSYSGSDNQLKTTTTLDNTASWTVTFDEEGNAVIINKGNTQRYLQWNSNSGQERFACYKGTQKAVQIYKLDSGAPSCEHTNTTTETVPATCTATGSATVTCNDCNVIVKTTELPATGHTYVDGVCACGVTAGVGYELVTADEVVAGYYLVGAVRSGAYDDGAYLARGYINSGDWYVSNTVSKITDDVIYTADIPEDAQVFVLTGDNTNGFTIGFESEGEMLYLGYTAVANRKLAFGAEYANTKWKVAIHNDGVLLTDGNVSVYQNSTAESAIRNYTTAYENAKGIYLFKQVSGSAPEIPDTPACEHTNTTTETVDATCTTKGSTTVKCDDCGETVSTTAIPTVGHVDANADFACDTCNAACGIAMTEAPVAGDVIVIANGKNVMKSVANGKKMASETGTVSGNLLVVTDTMAQLIVSIDTNGYYTFTTAEGKYLTSGATGNELKLADAASNYSLWTVEAATAGTFYIKSVNAKYNGAAQSMEYYSGFTTYGHKTTSIYQMVLYLVDQIDTTCKHANTTEAEAVDPTCTEVGYTAGVYCKDCLTYIEGHEPVDALGHTFGEVQCSVCGYYVPNSTLTLDVANAFGLTFDNNAYSADKYYVTGVIKNFDDTENATKYGNFTIEDSEGNTLYIYGLYSADGSTRYDAMQTKPVVGDTVTLYGVIGTYNGSQAQMKNAWLIEIGCQHTNTTTETVEATCTATGSVTVTCDDCGETLSTTELPVAGHTWTDATTEAPKTCSVCGETDGDKLGTEANPIPVTFTMNEDFTEGTATVTVPAGTYYYQAFGIGGMELTINDGEATLMSGNPRMPVVFPVTNDGEEAADFVLTVTYPAGSQMNPVELQLGYNYASIKAGNNQGFYYTWTAPADGTLTLSFSAEDADWNPCGWAYVVNNMTSYAYGDMQWSDSDPVVNPAVVTVKAGDEIQLIVNAYDPADPWNAPAADLYTEASFECEIHGDLVCEDNYDNATHDYTCSICGAAVIDDEAHEYTEGVCACGAVQPGSELNPITLTELENTVENTGVVYYQCFFSGTVMHINSDNDYVVTVNGETFESFFGMLDMDVETPNPRMPFVFSIEGEGTLQIDFEYPEGTMMNPAELFIGYNYATIEAGNNQGFFYTWTAPADGTLTLTFSAMDSDWAECGWTYVVNNMTSYAYGDTQWSDSDPVVNPYVITVEAGDEIQLIVNTYDPANMWSNPAGEITIEARFECDEHGDCEYEDNYDDATHDYVCTVCGTVLINDEAHDFGEGACVCGAEKSGSESNPIWLYEQENTVENEDKLFYQGYFSNMTMTVLGEGDFKVEYNGQTFNSENGMISIPVSSPYPRMPVVFALEGNGTYQINFSFPEGHMENPAELNVGTVAAPGENTAAVPGNGTPYFYAWTAPMDGTLTINMVSGNFVTGIDNMTTGVYGDMQFASDGVTTFTVELNAGDEIRVTVGTEDYTTADVKLTAAFEEKGAEFAGMTMSLGESLAVNFVIDVAQLEGEGHVAVITKTYADGTDPMTVKIPQSEWAVYSGTRYYFTFAGVKAKEMTDEFTVIIYNAEGKQVSKTYTRTIEDYCRKQISNYEAAAKPDAERLALYVDILKYGAAAQNYFNYNVNKPATANLTAAQLAYGTQSADVTDIRVKGEGYMGATLSLVNEIQLNFVFSNTVANKAAYAVVTFEHYDGEAVSQKIEAADFQAYGTSGKYITVSGMKMADYLQVVTLTLYDANGNALSVTKDSVGAYVARMSDADPLYETVVKLGKSSLAYFK